MFRDYRDELTHAAIGRDGHVAVPSVGRQVTTTGIVNRELLCDGIAGDENGESKCREGELFHTQPAGLHIGGPTLRRIGRWTRGRTSFAASLPPAAHISPTLSRIGTSPTHLRPRSAATQRRGPAFSSANLVPNSGPSCRDCRAVSPRRAQRVDRPSAAMYVRHWKMRRIRVRPTHAVPSLSMCRRNERQHSDRESGESELFHRPEYPEYPFRFAQPPFPVAVPFARLFAQKFVIDQAQAFR
jgi:hypothetical protein